MPAIVNHWGRNNPKGRRGPVARPLAERFWEKVDKRGPDDCWQWLGATWEDGRGVIAIRKKNYAAPRIALELVGIALPEGMQALHRCDSPGCVNPAHLFVGTTQDNMQDAANKRRNAHSRKTHCKEGHPYDEANTIVGKAASGRPSRKCRTCARRWTAESARRRRTNQCPSEA